MRRARAPAVKIARGLRDPHRHFVAARGHPRRIGLEARQDARGDRARDERERRRVGAEHQRGRSARVRCSPPAGCSLCAPGLPRREPGAVGGGRRTRIEVRAHDAIEPVLAGDTRNENTMIAIAAQSEALTTMPATLAARWPGRWRTCASASAATGVSQARAARGARGTSGATVATAAREPEGDRDVTAERAVRRRRRRRARACPPPRAPRGIQAPAAEASGKIHRAVAQALRPPACGPRFAPPTTRPRAAMAMPSERDDRERARRRERTRPRGRRSSRRRGRRPSAAAMRGCPRGRARFRRPPRPRRAARLRARAAGRGRAA